MPSKNGFIAAGVVTAGLIAAGGASMASAATSTTDGSQGYGYAANGEGQPGQGQDGRQGPGGPGHRMGTRVTGDEAKKVTDAVKAKDSSVSVEAVLKDGQGAYHVMGKADGKRVMYQVSKDLKTVTKDDHQGRQGRGGPGGRHLGTPVGKTVSDQVTAAVKAKDSSVTVKHVFKRQDGSFEVFATKAGKPAPFHVSKDLKTVTQQTMPQQGKGGPGGHDGPGRGGQDNGGRGEQSTPTPSESSSTSA